MSWVDVFLEPILENIIGGSNGGQAVLIGTLFLITILAVLLLAARLPIELVLILVSPAVIVASFSGLLPPLAFGVVVFLIALFFTGIILAMAK